MKRTLTVLTTLALVLGLVAMPAAAQGPPEHGHVLLLGVETVPNPDYPAAGPPVFVTGFRKCVDIANARPLPLHVHHDTIHMGHAGHALRSAGHLVVPLAPLTPYTSCADIEAEL